VLVGENGENAVALEGADHVHRTARMLVDGLEVRAHLLSVHEGLNAFIVHRTGNSRDGPETGKDTCADFPVSKMAAVADEAAL
jgi:hypothetical protein